MQDEDFVETIKEKTSTIPNFPKSTIDSLVKVWSVVTGSRKERVENKINKIVNSAYNRHVLSSKNPVLSFPSKEESKGDVEIGYACAGDQVLHPFYLTTEDLRQHIFITALSGFGKTTQLFNIINALVSKNLSFLAFDWKRDLRPLISKHEQINAIRWNRTKFNPLTNVPDNVDRKLWTKQVLSILAHSSGLFQATPNYIIKSLEQLYDDKKDGITFQDLLEFLEHNVEQSRRNSEYLDTAVNRLYGINYALKDVLSCRAGWDIKSLFSSQLIIELDPLDFPSAAFFTQCLLMWEYHRRLANQIRYNKKSTLDKWFKDNFCMIIMPEAHNTQFTGQEKSLVAIEHSDPPLSVFFSQARELGLGVLAESQFPDKVMSAFRINASTKIIGGTTEADIQKELADSIGLGRDEYKILGRLKKGNWICNVSGRTRPFVLHTPESSRGDLIAEAELLTRSKPFITKLDMKRQEMESRMFLDRVEKDSDKIPLPALPEDAWNVLDYSFNHEFAFQQKIADDLGLSPHRITDIKRLLTEKGLIRIERFPVYEHKRVHYVLTPKTLEIFKTLGKSPQRIAYWKFLSTNPGYEHRYFQFLFSGMHRKLGWKGSIERDLPNGRRVDIFMQKEEDGERKIIEIETSTTDLLNKIRVLSDGYCDELVLLYKEMAGVQLARSKLEQVENVPSGKIWVGLIRDYVEILGGILKARDNAGIKPKQDGFPSENKENGNQPGNNEVTK
jgi:DNA-binding MarR family transcriptional regulator